MADFDDKFGGHFSSTSGLLKIQMQAKVAAMSIIVIGLLRLDEMSCKKKNVVVIIFRKYAYYPGV